MMSLGFTLQQPRSRLSVTVRPDPLVFFFAAFLLMACSLGASGLTGSNASVFAQTNNCGTMLATGATCTSNVTFAAAGSVTAFLSIADNATGSPLKLMLNGTGTSTTSVQYLPLVQHPAHIHGLLGARIDPRQLVFERHLHATIALVAFLACCLVDQDAPHQPR